MMTPFHFPLLLDPLYAELADRFNMNLYGVIHT